MTSSEHGGQWQVQAREGKIEIKTSRVGMFEIHAHAPIVGGSADWTAEAATLTFGVGIDEVKTGNPLLDPEVHALVHKGSDGVLTFTGSGSIVDDEATFEGTATAGNIEVPLVLTGDIAADEQTTRQVSISGTASFHDIHIPLPGLSHLDHIDVHIKGVLQLTR